MHRLITTLALVLLAGTSTAAGTAPTQAAALPRALGAKATSDVSTHTYANEWATTSGTSTPNALAVDGSGNVVVLGNDSTGGAFWVRWFTPAGQRIGGFDPSPARARNMAIDAAGNLHIVQSVGEPEGQINVYSPQGTLLREYATPDQMAAEGFLDAWSPNTVTFAPDGTIYADSGATSEKVVHLSAEGHYLSSFGTRGTGPGQFALYGPTDIKVAADGTVLVADAGNDRIQRFTADGQYLSEWGQSGSQPGQFTTPSSMAITPRQTVLVTDGTTRVQEFALTGEYIAELPDEALRTNSAIIVGADDTVYVGGYLDSLTKGVARFMPTGPPNAGGVSVTKRVLKTRRNRVTIPIRCTAATACRGKIQIKAGKRNVASGKYSVKADGQSKVRVRLALRGQQLVQSKAGTKKGLKVVVRLTPASGQTVTVSAKIRR